VSTSGPTPTPNGNHPPEPEPRPPADDEPEYEPGDTVSRGMNLACGLLLLAFALLSCGFVVSVLSLRLHH
jgi:hypothetical protein